MEQYENIFFNELDNFIREVKQIIEFSIFEFYPDDAWKNVDIEIENDFIDYLDNKVNELIKSYIIIKYTDATKYLLHHDPSLTISLNFAIANGYTYINQLSSSILASLLLQHHLRTYWSVKQNDLIENVKLNLLNK